MSWTSVYQHTAAVRWHCHLPSTSYVHLSTLNIEVDHDLDIACFLSPRCTWAFRSSGMLGSLHCQLFTDVSGRHIGPAFKVKQSKTAIRTLRMEPTGWPETSTISQASGIGRISVPPHCHFLLVFGCKYSSVLLNCERTLGKANLSIPCIWKFSSHLTVNTLTSHCKEWTLNSALEK